MHSVSYDTPKFGGFSAMAQYTIPQATRNALERSTTKKREINIGNQYAAGPLTIVTDYVRKDNNITAADFTSATDKA